MAKRPLRNRQSTPVNKSIGPRSHQRRPRKNKPLLIYFAVTLVILVALYANILFHKQHHANQQNIQGNAPTGQKAGSDNPPQQQQQRRDNAQPQTAKSVQSIQYLKPDENPAATTLLIWSAPHCQGNPYDKAVADTAVAVYLMPHTFPQSVRVNGKGMVETHVGAPLSYKGTVMELEGCVDFYDLYKDTEKRVKFVVHAAASKDKVLMASRQISPQLQQQFATVQDLSTPHTRFVFSATSSKYFGYQVLANALGFLDSKQTDASWTRLLSAGQKDDLAERFPTFTAPKSLYDKFYQPINKPDVIDKWFHSADAPHPDDTIVVIDPDNWLINDLHGWAKRVSPKNALAQAAYYRANTMLQDLWQDICKHNCHIPTDPAAVPYLIKASDLKQVAPLWRAYSIDIKERFKDNTTFKEKYGPGLGVRWASEMFGFNGACTHLNIKTTIVTDMQLRDVDGGKRQWDRLRHTMPMIHMGRAWFPKEKPELAAPWRHSSSNEPGSIAASGIQVWCKCNGTAPFVQPWPLPDNLDFVSYHTLRLLHDSVEKFGPVPVNETFRKEKLNFYAWSLP